MKENKNLLLTNILLPFVSGPMIVVEIYIMSWLISCYNETKGPIYDMDTVYNLY
jgi:hypothetical protein